MLFFNTKKRLIDMGVLKGATDWHSHILPGVDDGVHDHFAPLRAGKKRGRKDHRQNGCEKYFTHIFQIS